MAHKKASGSTKASGDSFSKRLGFKIATGQKANPGNIIVKQRGTKFRAGENVKKGSDDTLYAVKKGLVSVRTKYKRSVYNNKKKIVKYVNVLSSDKKKISS